MSDLIKKLEDTYREDRLRESIWHLIDLNVIKLNDARQLERL